MPLPKLFEGRLSIQNTAGATASPSRAQRVLWDFFGTMDAEEFHWKYRPKRLPTESPHSVPDP